MSWILAVTHHRRFQHHDDAEQPEAVPSDARESASPSRPPAGLLRDRMADQKVVAKFFRVLRMSPLAGVGIIG
jgi:hypothetical protein